MSDTWSVSANLFVKWRALGGSLVVNSAELRFEPHALEAALGGRTHFAVPLGDIERVSVVRERWYMPRKQVRVDAGDGRSALLLVNKQVEVASRIVDAARAAGGRVDIE